MTGIDGARIAAELPDWTLEEGGRAITRDYRFADFSRAFAFMTQVAMAAEKLDHHPEWSNVYGRVSVRLTTHATGGLTDRDIALARLMEDAAR
ncbi:MAG: 4a-hydroxytetrahydrobiopterin dehydratase [Acuticoccus sp.]